MPRRIPGATFLALSIGLLPINPAQAAITALVPLSAVLKESNHILTVQVEALDPDKRTMVLAVDEHLKDKAPFTKLPVLLKGDSEADKSKQVPLLLKRLAPKLPLVLFVKKKGDNDYLAFAYTNGTWFQLRGVKPADSALVRWSFTHTEPYLRRTFKGTTEL